MSIGSARDPQPEVGVLSGSSGRVNCGQAGAGSAAKRVSAATMRVDHVAVFDSFRWVRRAWRAMRPAIENSRRRSRLGSHRRAAWSVQGEHLGPRDQFAGECDDREPDPVLRRSRAAEGCARPVSLAVRMRSSQRARRRCRSSSPAS